MAPSPFTANSPAALVSFAASSFDETLKGAKPREQPTKYDLVVNLRAANALGLTIAQSVLVLADRLIE